MVIALAMIPASPCSAGSATVRLGVRVGVGVRLWLTVRLTVRLRVRVRLGVRVRLSLRLRVTCSAGSATGIVREGCVGCVGTLLSLVWPLLMPG